MAVFVSSISGVGFAQWGQAINTRALDIRVPEPSTITFDGFSHRLNGESYGFDTATPTTYGFTTGFSETADPSNEHARGYAYTGTGLTYGTIQNGAETVPYLVGGTITGLGADFHDAQEFFNDNYNITTTWSITGLSIDVATWMFVNEAQRHTLLFAGNDSISGSAFNDVLDGGFGSDSMAGGLGNDLYYVDHAGDVVTEAAGGGIDTVFTTVSHALAANSDVEFLRTSSTATTTAVNLTGSNTANTLIGNAGANILLGRGDLDILSGLGGSDFLDGGIGNDRMVGGLGDDTYHVDHAGDFVIEAAGEGFDWVNATASYVLLATSEAEVLRVTNAATTTAINLTGSDTNNFIEGNAGANRLYGRGGNDLLRGFGGNDILDSGWGVDSLFGGQGNDIYYVKAGDGANEVAGEGFDTLYTSTNFVLGETSEVEVLRTFDPAGTDGIRIAGSNFANTMIGNAGANRLNGLGGNDTLSGAAGNDVLDGGTGVDRLVGGTGDDTYLVDNTADVVVELIGEGLLDQVLASVGYTLANGVGINVMGFAASLTTMQSLIGNDFVQRMNGNQTDNSLLGRGGDDSLYGFGGNDWLNGGLGKDVLFGGAGSDLFYLYDAPNATTNVDSLRDFNSTDDTIALNGLLYGLDAGVLAADAFHLGAAAADANDRIIYSRGFGELYFDADGTGASAAVLIARLPLSPALTNQDFIVFGI